MWTYLAAIPLFRPYSLIVVAVLLGSKAQVVVLLCISAVHLLAPRWSLVGEHESYTEAVLCLPEACTCRSLWMHCQVLSDYNYRVVVLPQSNFGFKFD